MSTTEEKNFGITHVFKNIDGLAKQNEMVGNVEKHFGAFWAVKLYKYQDGDLRIGLNCEKFQSHDWSIKTNFDILVGGQSFRTGSYLFTQDEKNFYSMHISKNEFSNYEINKTATVEVRVRISETTGIMQIESKNFSDDVAKESSDVVLVVGDQKRKNLGTLKLADFFNCQTAIDRCEEFLFFRSHQPFEFKFQTALKYKMEKLKKASARSGAGSESSENSTQITDGASYDQVGTVALLFVISMIFRIMCL
ncbi:Protein CBG22594 [Caenorhabditis briggsae]|uniref:Protein CBG22594 n=1 Tax=Caenorhabditis briggsae TaxID=6238 RepID=A8Y2L2_CAEBR|nr:Protein CBG22594 [Caenorhabditis briggsae]CAP39136.2 Protein CBG22594 [Caenorhabditis briggsae]